MALLDTVELDLGTAHDDILTVYIDVADTSLSRKWLAALDHIIQNRLHLEKNYCWLGWPEGPRNGQLILSEINRSIEAINRAEIGYLIRDHYSLDNSLIPGEILPLITQERSAQLPGEVDHAHFNQLHRYFEDLQGTCGAMSPYYTAADAATRWHIRQLNLLCHEFESWAISHRKLITAPEWVRPSQLMCWLNAPRFELAAEDLDRFGIETINRSCGAVYVGVNKAISKGHWEVFVDEAGYNPDHRTDSLTTTSLRPQVLAAGDFDIEWAQNPADRAWQQQHLQDFRTWLIGNGFDPADPALTIGHPQVGQVNLQRSFGTEDYRGIWHQLNSRLNVCAIRTRTASAEYPYCWRDTDYMEKQILCLG